MSKNAHASDPLVNHYAQHGYAIAPSVLPSELVSEMREHVEWLCKTHPDVRPEHLHDYLSHDDPFWQRVVCDPALAHLAARFLVTSDGTAPPGVALFATHYVAKPARTGMNVCWHQDGAYWPLDPMQVVSLWVAVTASHAGNGCLRVIPGTHRDPLHELRETDGNDALGSEMVRDVPDELQRTALNIELQPGDVSIHHPALIHCSAPNLSDEPRIGLTIRYIPTTTRITSSGVHRPRVVLGCAVPGINTYFSAPEFVPSRHMTFHDAYKYCPQKKACF